MTNKHDGNIKFRRLVEQHKAAYQVTQRKQKHEIAKMIVDHWMAQDPPGRFLARSGPGGAWQEITHREACKRASKALGEKDRTKRVVSSSAASTSSASCDKTNPLLRPASSSSPEGTSTLPLASLLESAAAGPQTLLSNSDFFLPSEITAPAACLESAKTTTPPSVSENGDTAPAAVCAAWGVSDTNNDVDSIIPILYNAAQAQKEERVSLATVGEGTVTMKTYTTKAAGAADPSSISGTSSDTEEDSSTQQQQQNWDILAYYSQLMTNPEELQMQQQQSICHATLQKQGDQYPSGSCYKSIISSLFSVLPTAAELTENAFKRDLSPAQDSSLKSDQDGNKVKRAT
jgi:hypothetical protein